MAYYAETDPSRPPSLDFTDNSITLKNLLGYLNTLYIHECVF